jgi:hypothetical protein
MKHIRILNGSTAAVRAEMSRIRSDVLGEYLKQEIEALELKLRYSKGGDHEVLQGACRALDDIQDLMKS